MAVRPGPIACTSTLTHLLTIGQSSLQETIVGVVAGQRIGSTTVAEAAGPLVGAVAAARVQIQHSSVLAHGLVHLTFRAVLSSPSIHAVAPGAVRIRNSAIGAHVVQETNGTVRGSGEV